MYSASATGSIHSVLKEAPGFVCSEYFPDVPLGQVGPGGVQCQDLQALTFTDETFDVVITEDVLEHVADYAQALQNIHRVLKPGGYHIFSVPSPDHIHLARSVVPRIKIVDGEERHLLPQEFHDDPLRPSGALVYTNFGTSLLEELFVIGFETTISLSRFILAKKFGIVDSYVFISRKLFQSTSRNQA